MGKAKLVPLTGYERYDDREMARRSTSFFEQMSRRRTVREFAPEPVAREVIEACLRTAGSAPSGANLQPWHFVVVSNPDIKRRIRLAAEEEEEAFYTRRAPQEWLEALAPLGTDSRKPFLEIAPYLIAVFVQPFGKLPDGRRLKHYYATESVGLATGLLIAALHNAGLATLTHTPSPMGFLTEILGRPRHERPFVLLVTGYPAPGARVPDIGRKPLGDYVTFLAGDGVPSEAE